MGYRSDIGLLISKDSDGSMTIPEFLALAKLKDIDPVEMWKNCKAQIKWDNDTFLFTVDNVKWYTDSPDNYPEVDCIERLKQFMCGVDGLSYVWVRIGEELEDVEERYEGNAPMYGCLYVSRQIEVDVNIKPKESENDKKI